MHWESRRFGKVYIARHPADSPKVSGSTVACYLEFVNGEAVGRLNDYHVIYTAPCANAGTKRWGVPGCCTRGERAIFLVGSLSIAATWGLWASLRAITQHCLMDHRKETPHDDAKRRGNTPLRLYRPVVAKGRCA